MMHAVWTEWWLRPVMIAARVGLHSAVVWKWLYLSPFSASLVKFGVLHGPPKVLVAPNPTSSRSTSKTFGAPFGAWTGCGKSLLESLARRLIAPLNGAGGSGNTVPPLGAGAVSTLSALPGCAEIGDRRSLAASQPRNAPVASIVAASNRDRMMGTPR